MVSAHHGDEVGYPHGGSTELLARIKEARPYVHVFGHIHEAYGTVRDDSTFFVNAAMQDEHGRMFSESNRLIHAPVVLDL
jgi:Icc-related predicted phosphoesterase